MTRRLLTRSGMLEFPTFMPVTTFGNAFPLDELVRPYLARHAPAIMVSYHYAQAMKKKPKGILFVDSGGFASLFEGAELLDQGAYALIRTKEGVDITPPEVLAFQETSADIGATVDFIITPNCSTAEAERRQKATIKNALWAVNNRKKSDFRLYASLQAWDAPSAHQIMEALAPHPFDGFALGGMVPRIQTPDAIEAIVKSIREVDQHRPLHVFGLGRPKLISRLFDLGVDSVDSSSYVRAAADGKWMHPTTSELLLTQELAGDATECSCMICARFSSNYLSLEGESNRMALALHNLATLNVLTSTLWPTFSPLLTPQSATARGPSQY